MSKICPNCQEVFDDSHGFCSNCGSRLVDNVDVNPALNLGDANAISGGVNINQSKNVTSHDTHYHTTTIQERSKSDSELKLDATNQLRAKAEEIMVERGRIDSVAMSQLRPLATQLGIDDETFKSIIKDVRSNRNGAASGLSAANARYLQQAQQAVQTNDMDGLSNLTPRLEAMAAISQDDNVQYLFHLTYSLFYPIKSMEIYERQTDENYWRSFWAIISYIRTGKHAEATNVLAKFDPLRYEKSEDDQNLLEAYHHLMKEDKDGAQEFLDDILGEPTEQVKPLLRAVESTLYEEEPESLEVRFYMERVMSKSDVVVKSQKKAEAPVAAEEPAKPAPKQEKKEESQPVVKVPPMPEVPKANKEAEELYTKACAASGAKHVMLLQKAADAGSLEAMYDLADCYWDGEGVEKNMPLAIKWMKKGADAGYVKAQTVLGAAYLQGMEGLDQNYALSEKYLLMSAEKDNADAQAFLSHLYIAMEDYNKALLWARKAAQMEHPQACFALGRIYDEGLGVDVNHIEGLKWFEKAANGGDADAQNMVGNIYTDADFVKHDLQKAYKYYQMAAAQGHAYGMLNLGLSYLNGDGVEASFITADEWIRKAADAGVPEAVDILNQNPLFNDEVQTEVPVSSSLSEEEAQALYDAVDSNSDPGKLDDLKQAAETGDVWAMFFYARLYSVSKSVKSNYKLALDYYTKAADAGNPRAMNNIGVLYENGTGVKQNYAEAANWYRKAADAGYAFALGNLGKLYLNGNGIKADIKKAMELFKQSADSGDAFAMCNLGICYEDKQDYKSAKKWYEKAIKSGNAFAYARMGRLYEDGLGVDPNYTEAIVLYRKGADEGDTQCMKSLGYCYVNGNGVAQNHAEAKNWFLKAAQLNSEDVVFFNAWVAQGDKKSIAVHMDFQVNNYKNKKLFIRYTTEMVNTGDVISEFDYEIKPDYDQSEWQDFVYYLFENAQNWPNADLLLNLRTSIQVLDSTKKAISEQINITYNARHRIRMFHENELTLGLV